MKLWTKKSKSLSDSAKIWRKLFLVLAIVLFAASVGMRSTSAVEEHRSAEVLELKLDGEVEPILASYIDEGLADAAQGHAALVLITMRALPVESKAEGFFNAWTRRTSNSGC